jgi:hypothetical protein
VGSVRSFFTRILRFGIHRLRRMPPYSQLYQTWWRAPEEDSRDGKVFRSEGYPLPPVRGRTGFEFFPDGRYAAIGIGANDVPVSSDGTFEVQPNNAPSAIMTLQLKAGTADPVTLHVVELDDNMLLVASDDDV